jgi:addiction module HigA family antidote
MYDGQPMGKAGETSAPPTAAGKTVRRRLPAVTPMAGAPGARLSAKRAPPHPGHFLETRFLKPLGITQQSLAVMLGVSRRRVNELIRGHRSITADTAVRLAMFFGNEARFWMQLQTDWDLHHAQNALREREGVVIARMRKAE